MTSRVENHSFGVEVISATLSVVVVGTPSEEKGGRKALIERGRARLNCCCVSSLSWLGTTLCPPDCLVKSDIKVRSCAAIFRLGIVVLHAVCACEVFCGLHVAHVRIICPVRDVTHVRKCTRPSPTLPYCKRREAGQGPGNEAINEPHLPYKTGLDAIQRCYTKSPLVVQGRNPVFNHYCVEAL